MRSLKFVFVIVTLFLFMSTTIHAQDSTPTYAVTGPYAVGRAWFLTDTDTPNPVTVAVWYPASDQLSGTLTAPDDAHLIDSKRVKTLEGGASWGSSTLSATPDSSQSPYPLVIYSPGYGTSLSNYINIEQHLASYGFVVMGAMPNDEALWSHYILRPAVASHEIDFAAQLAKMDGSFKGLIDTKHVAVVGHSSGGYTALALASAQLDMTWFKGWCTDHISSPDAKLLCPELLPHQNDMLSLAKLDAMPADLWPSWSDPRVSAVVSQSGDGYFFGPKGLASVKVPVMVEVGAHDDANTPEWSAYLTYDHVSSEQKSEVVFTSGPADHFIFGAQNTSTETHDLINHFTTAFLLDNLKGDDEAHKALLSNAVNFDGIDYKTTLK